MTQQDTEKSLGQRVKLLERENAMLKMQMAEKKGPSSSSGKTVPNEHPAAPIPDLTDNKPGLEKVIANISSSFLNIQPESVDNAITNALEKICTAIGYDAAQFVVNFEGKLHFAVMHEWRNGSIKFSMGETLNLSVYELTWILERVIELGYIHIPASQQLPAEAIKEKAFMDVLEIESLLGIQVSVENMPLAMLGFISKEATNNLDSLTLSLLRIAGNLLAHALSRKNAYITLLKSEQTYREIFNAISQPIFIQHGETGEILDINQAVTDVYGYTLGEISGEGYLRLFPEGKEEECMAVCLAYLKRAMEGEMPVFEWPSKTKDGRIFATEVTLRRALIGETPCVLAIERDISQEKITREALQQAADIFENIQVGLHIYELQDLNDDRTLRMIAANPATELLTGIPPGEIIGKTLDENFPHLRDKKVPQRYFDVIKTQTPNEINDIYYSDDRVVAGAFSVKAFPLPNNRVGVAFENITARIRAEHNLAGSEERYRNLFEQAADGILVCNAKGNIINANNNMCKMAGYTHDEITGKHLSSLFSEQVMLEKPLRFDLLNSGMTVVNERPLLRKNGEVLEIEMNTQLLPDGRYQALFRDISQRKHSEMALVASEQKYRLLFETATDAIMMLYNDIISDCNSTTLKMFACERVDIIGKSILAISAEKQYDGIPSKHLAPEIIKKAFSGSPQFFEWQHRRCNGMHFDAEISLQRVEFANNAFLQAIVRDISTRKTAERKLHEREAQLAHTNAMLEIILNTIPARVFWKDQNLRYLGCNHQFALDAGLPSPSGIIGKTDYELPWQKEVERYRADDLKVLQTNQPLFNIEEPQTTANGEIKWLRTNKVPLRNTVGKTIGVLGTYENISEVKLLERKILDEILKTEQKEREKFAKNLHDDLGPLLSSIKMYLNSLNKIATTQKQQFIIEQLNEIVTESIISTKEISNDLSPYVLKSYGLNTAIESFAKKVEDHLRINVESNLGEMRFPNEQETTLYRIIKELINNSIKHAQASVVELKLHFDNQQLSLDYSDNGIGFDINGLDNLQTKGMGISNIVGRAHSIKGICQFDSSLGNGMSFHVKIPV